MTDAPGNSSMIASDISDIYRKFLILMMSFPTIIPYLILYVQSAVVKIVNLNSEGMSVARFTLGSRRFRLLQKYIIFSSVCSECYFCIQTYIYSGFSTTCFGSLRIKFHAH